MFLIILAGVTSLSVAQDKQAEAVPAPAPPPVISVASPLAPSPSFLDEPEDYRPNQPVEPLTPASSWIRASDYPDEAIKEKRGGRAALRLSVNQWGRVSDCMVTRSSGSPDLDALSCKLVARRAVLIPATDGDANPIQSRYDHEIVWDVLLPAGPMPRLATTAFGGYERLPSPPVGEYRSPRLADYPKDLRDAGVEGSARLRLRIDPDGKVADCAIRESTGNAALDVASCDFVRSGGTFTPARGIDGEPTEGVFERVVTWQIPPNETWVTITQPMQATRPPIRFPAMGTGKSGIELEADKDGKVITCAAISEGELPKEMRMFETMCNEAKVRGIDIVKDANGNPMARTVKFVMSVETKTPDAKAGRSTGEAAGTEN